MPRCRPTRLTYHFGAGLDALAAAGEGGGVGLGEEEVEGDGLMEGGRGMRACVCGRMSRGGVVYVCMYAGMERGVYIP